jgi:hypothetical protein
VGTASWLPGHQDLQDQIHNKNKVSEIHGSSLDQHAILIQISPIYLVPEIHIWPYSLQIWNNYMQKLFSYVHAINHTTKKVLTISAPSLNNTV